MRILSSLVVCLSLFAFAGRGATFVVSNTNDAGLGSLRDAINQANANSGADTIAFAIPGTGPHTIRIVGSALPTMTNSGTTISGETQAGYSNGYPAVQILGPSTNSAANDWGLYMLGNNMVAKGLRFSGFRYAGIVADGFTPNNATVAGCLVDGNANGIVGSGSGLVIGGSTTNTRNVIINNQTNGIIVFWGNATIRGNYIGVAADGVTAAGNGENGIWLSPFSGTNLIQGASNFPQVISGNGQNGISLQQNATASATDNKIEGNYIGTDVTGTNAVPNGAAGVRIDGGIGNTIGGLSVTQRNIIAGNSAEGVHITVTYYYPGLGTKNKVVGNFIGLGADGETVLTNYHGVQIYSASENIVGGTTAGSGNRFGGSEREQVYIRSVYLPCLSNVVQGNWFGISISTQRLPVAMAGVGIVGSTAIAAGSSYNLIGGTTTNARNYFCGAGSGVAISGTNAQFNSVQGNWIGVGPGGVMMENNSYGVDVYNAPRNQIGGVFTNEGNVISGNQYYGIRITGSNAYANVVAGNIIGLDPTGNFSISNRYTGVDVSGGAYSNRIGGTNAATRNVIAGNGGNGITIRDGSFGNLVTANHLGVNTAGTLVVNGTYGVDIDDAPRNQIGGAYTNLGNVISGSLWYGIFLRGTGSFDNVVEGNIIGLDPSGTVSVSNRYDGVDIAGGAFSNRVGGTNNLTMNVIAGNAGGGVVIREAATYGNTVARNFIGMNRTNAPLGNGPNAAGIWVNNSPGNTIGPGNFIGNATREGLYISGTSAVNNVIIGNIVGQDSSGTAHPNAYGGINVNDAPGTQVGQNGAGNYVSGNNGGGINIDNASSGTVVRGNYVGLQYPGLSTVLPNNGYGLDLNAPYVTVGGTNAGNVNYFSGNTSYGINAGPGATNSFIAGNIIGLDTTGLAIMSNKFGGVYIDGPGIRLGSTEPYGRNLIAGNQGHGVYITARGTNATLRNNYIGVDGSGMTPMRNTGRGILIDAVNVTIGGTNVGEGNLIARNGSNEIEFNGPAAGNRVIGNYIGVQNGGVAFTTNADNDIALAINNSPGNQILNNVIGQETIGIQLNGTGTYNTIIRGNSIGEYNLESISNTSWGIQIINSSSNTIGGTSSGEGNLITRNFGGIAVTNNGSFVAVANHIVGNLIHSNGTRLNIELGPNGFNTNDNLDTDSGENRLQNRPAITNAISINSALTTYAQGVLTSAPNTTFWIDIYRSFGTNAEGYRYLGRTTATTDGSGYGTFSAGFAINVASGIYITATATDPEGNTSEFAVAPTGLVFKTTADFDGDGIPDYWENLYGLNAFFSNAGLDLDGDGVKDYDEYIADTPANDPTKFLHITDLAGAAPRTITFPTSPLRRYELQYNTDLTTNLWTATPGTITGQPLQVTITDTNATSIRHYRIGAKLP